MKSDETPIQSPPSVIDPPLVRRHKGLAPLIRAQRLRYPELTEPQIAERVGCTKQNVNSVLKRFFGPDNHPDTLQDYQSSKADIYDAIQRRILGSIGQQSIEEAQLLPRVKAAAILEDKARTIRGQATAINVTQLWDCVEAIREMRADSK